MTTDPATLARQLPKVELHVHLEGAMPPATLLRLARKHSLDLPLHSLEDTERFYAYRDFLHFLEVYQTSGRCLLTGEDFAEITYEFLQNQAAQHVLYSEVMVSLADHMLRGLDPHEVMAGIFEGQRRGEADFPTRMQIILDAGRQWPDLVDEVSKIAVEYAGRGVLGFGIGGDEANFPPEMFTDAFARVKAAGLRRTAHAGEVAGASSMWGAIRALDAERLGHGVHAHDDPDLLAYLRTHRIPLDMCPVSNVRTGAVPSLQEHPIRRYLDEGLLVTVNSDDPPMFGTSITNEYRVLAEELGFGRQELEQVALNAVEASFLLEVEKDALRRRMITEMATL